MDEGMRWRRMVWISNDGYGWLEATASNLYSIQHNPPLAHLKN